MIYQDILIAIREDNRSGAAALTRRGAEALVAFAQNHPAASSNAFEKALIDLCRRLVAAQPIEDKPPEELWPDPPPGVAVVNRYFETTSLSLFAAVVTEDGPLAPSQVRRALNDLAFHPALLPAG